LAISRTRSRYRHCLSGSHQENSFKIMNADLKNMLNRVTTWPEEDQEELAQIGPEIEARRHGAYHATLEELAAIDEALAAVARGEVASEEEVEAVFAKYRRA
jgi:hypothetical protein